MPEYRVNRYSKGWGLYDKTENTYPVAVLEDGDLADKIAQLLNKENEPCSDRTK